MSIENWKTDLAPLLHSFKAKVPERWEHPEVGRRFTDQFGNVLEFNRKWDELVQFLHNPSLETAEIKDLDRGYMSYTAYKHADSYYIFYETQINCRRCAGHFIQFVVVPDLDGIAQFVDGLNNDDY